MIHRIDRVNPDVDDRVIKPNEARMAKNLRFGASIEDTNLSGGTLVLGNTKLPFIGSSTFFNTVGVYSDFESGNVFFAAGVNTSCAIYRINGQTNDIEIIVKGDWLNFQIQNDYNVSIVVAGGNLYWTDNVNEPRVVNIEKGIRTEKGQQLADVYPSIIENWHYSQIKRPPGEALIILPSLNVDEVSKTVLNKTQVQQGLQYSYYYIYDGGAESRLAPYSEISYATENVSITIPLTEWNSYTSQIQIIKSIIYVIRNGNDGVWREFLNITQQSSWAQVQVIKNVLTTIKGAVASDITDARYDSVPLLSKTMEVAQNRLNHANYTLDRYFDGISIEAKIGYVEQFKNNINLNDTKYFRYSFIPWGKYTIGVELVDEYGRTFPVPNAVEVQAPFTVQSWQRKNGTIFYPGQGLKLSYQTNTQSDITITDYNQNGTSPWQFLYGLLCEYKIKLKSGASLPAWVKRINVVRSKAKNIVKMIQGTGRMLLWYEAGDGTERITSLVQPQLIDYTPDISSYYIPNSIYDSSSINNTHTFTGYVIAFSPKETPIVFEEDMYITLYVMYNFKSSSTSIVEPSNLNGPNNYWVNQGNQSGQDVGRLGAQAKFKVYAINGNYIYIKSSDPISINNPTNAAQINTVDLNKKIELTPYSFATTVNTSGVTSPSEGQKEDKNILLTYSFVITVEKNIDDQVVYTTQDSYDVNTFNTAITQNGELKSYLTGDGYMCRINKRMPAMSYNCYIYTEKQLNGAGPLYQGNKTIRMDQYSWAGTFISMSPRDIYDEKWNQNIGQLNTTDYTPSQPQRLENAICFSAPFIQGTQTNGLNKFNSLDFRQAPAENGSITALVVTNAAQKEPGVMLAIGTNGISSFYYDAIQLTNVDGTSNVATTNTYLGSQRPLLGQYGCRQSMSVTKTSIGTVYWWSDVVNDLIRYSNAGLERLGLTFSFANFLRNNYSNCLYAITWYDQITDEVNLYGQGVDSNLYYETAVFSERYKTFQGTREYYGVTGAAEQLAGRTLKRVIGTATKQYYFIGNDIYVSDAEQDTTQVPNNYFFGVYRNPQIKLVTNESPATVKTWNQVKIFGSRPISTKLECSIDDGTPSLTSAIDPGYYINRKGDWEAAIRRAGNTVGGLMGGKLMESRIIYSIFAWNADVTKPDLFTKLNFIEVKSNVSIVQ